MARQPSIFIWGGGTSTAQDNSANWLKSDGVTAWSDGSCPGWDGTNNVNVDGDTIYYSQNALHAPGGIDLSPGGQIAAIYVQSGFGGTGSGNTVLGIGSTGSPLKVNMATGGIVNIDGSKCGNIFIAGGGGNGIPLLFLMGWNTGYKVTLDGNLGTVKLYKGIAEILGTAVIATALNVMYLTTPSTDVTLTIDAGATLPSSVTCEGGVINCSTPVPLLTMLEGSGVWYQNAGDITNSVISGGTVFAVAGNIAAAVINGPGTLDMSKGLGPRTITSPVINPGGALNLANGQRNVTVSGQITNNGGALQYDPGALLTIGY